MKNLVVELVPVIAGTSVVLWAYWRGVYALCAWQIRREYARPPE